MLLDLLLENIAAARHTAVDMAADMAFDLAFDLAFDKAVDLVRAMARPFEKGRARPASLSIRLLKHQPIYHIDIGQPGAFVFFLGRPNRPTKDFWCPRATPEIWHPPSHKKLISSHAFKPEIE